MIIRRVGGQGMFPWVKFRAVFLFFGAGAIREREAW
jgi:hypothetical protein